MMARMLVRSKLSASSSCPVVFTIIDVSRTSNGPKSRFSKDKKHYARYRIRKNDDDTSDNIEITVIKHELDNS